MRKKRKIVILIIIVFLLTPVMFGIKSFQDVKYRAQILLYKITGELDATPWSKVFVALLPPRLQPKPPNLTRKVEIKRFDGENPNPQIVLWDTPEGDFWGQLSDEWLLRFLFYEQTRWKIYQNDFVSVSEGDVVLDVGSHLGTFTRKALNRGAKLVVCFECEPIVLTCFRRTFEREISERRVIIIDAAAWNTSGILRFKQDRNNTGGGYIDEDGFLEVRAVTIDDVVEKLKLDQIDFIKMDIEGSERQALEGAQRTLSFFAPQIAVCIYHKKNDRHIIPELVLALQPSYRLRKSFTQAYFFK